MFLNIFPKRKRRKGGRPKGGSLKNKPGYRAVDMTRVSALVPTSSVKNLPTTKGQVKKVTAYVGAGAKRRRRRKPRVRGLLPAGM